MATSKSDSSAPRNNPRVPHRTNDTVDDVVIGALMAVWNYAGDMEEQLVEASEDALAEAVHDGFKLREASPATWSAFLAHPLWKQCPKRRPKEGEQSEAIKHSFAIYFGNAHRATKSTSDYQRAVKELECRALSQPQIVEEIVKGPAHVRGLCSDYAARLRDLELAGRPVAARTQAPKVDRVPVPDTPKDGPPDASARRHAKILQNGVELSLPQGFLDLGSISEGGRFTMTFDVVAGSGSSFVIKPRKLKAAKSKTAGADTATSKSQSAQKSKSSASPSQVK